MLLINRRKCTPYLRNGKDKAIMNRENPRLVRTWAPGLALGVFGFEHELGDAGAVIQKQCPVAGAVVRAHDHALPAAASRQSRPGRGMGNGMRRRAGGVGKVGPGSRRAGSGGRRASARERIPRRREPRCSPRAGSRRSSAPRACSPWRSGARRRRRHDRVPPFSLPSFFFFF